MDKIKDILTKLLGAFSFFSKNAGHIKTGLIVGMILVLVFAIKGFKDDRFSLSERVSVLDSLNHALRRDVASRDSTVAILEGIVIVYKDSLGLSEKKLSSLKQDYEKLNKKYAELKEEVEKVPVDSSYQYLQEVYPYPGPLEYPFNSGQIQGMHITVLQKDYLEELRSNLILQVGEYKDQIAIRDTILLKTEEALSMERETIGDLQQVISNKDEIIGEKDKQLSRELFRKNLWRGISGVLSIISIVLLL